MDHSPLSCAGSLPASRRCREVCGAPALKIEAQRAAQKQFRRTRQRAKAIIARSCTAPAQNPADLGFNSLNFLYFKPLFGQRLSFPLQEQGTQALTCWSHSPHVSSNQAHPTPGLPQTTLPQHRSSGPNGQRGQSRALSPPAPSPADVVLPAASPGLQTALV